MKAVRGLKIQSRRSRPSALVLQRAGELQRAASVMSEGHPQRPRPHGSAHLEDGLLEKIAEIFLLTGVSSAQLTAAVARALRVAGRRVPRLSSPSASFDWWLYARVLSIWHRSPEFTDENGVGRPLPLAGPSSFQTLVAKALPGSKPRIVLAALKSLRAVTISPNRLITPTSRSLIVEQRTQMTLLRAMQMCDALISTVHSNWVWRRSNKPERLLFERSVVSEKFDMQHLRAFDGLVRVHGQALLELLDGWLAEHETRDGNGTSRNEGAVGVEIYVFAKRTKQAKRARRRAHS